jgi:hypothetical protein
MCANIFANIYANMCANICANICDFSSSNSCTDVLADPICPQGWDHALTHLSPQGGGKN